MANNHVRSEENFQLSVVILTLNAGDKLAALIDALHRQQLQPLEIIIIDSASDDETDKIAQEVASRVEVIPREDFNHGRVRNMAAKMAQGDILVFLSQDALPKDETFLEEILRPIRDGKAVAVTARQIPYPEATPLEVYARSFNYSIESYIRSREDIPSMGVMAYFFSNAASCIQIDALHAIGGFREDLIVNEDMMLCATLLHEGYSVAYQAQAVVLHSHDFNLKEVFGRYFDIGVFFSQAGEWIEKQNPVVLGQAFASGQIKYLMKTGAWIWIPVSIIESFLKYLAFQVGLRERRLPKWMKRGFSLQKSYWHE